MKKGCTAQEAPLLELHTSIAGVLATYDDGVGQLPDAADTHLALHVGQISVDADVFPGALQIQVHSNHLRSQHLWSSLTPSLTPSALDEWVPTFHAASFNRLLCAASVAGDHPEMPRTHDC